ncbi:U32 family peptidase, partial [Mobiluncus mulieris]|uniref:peptidase U32 family protein n=1 Tax=Mobiluncus mulieris TaxID=2052 RepID=UPI0021E309F0
MSIPEVLAPAGNLAVLKAAVDFGADAVYCGGKAFGMRSGPKNFTLDDFATALDYAHARGARVYATVNIVPNNEEIEAMNRYMGELAEVGIDALIISDIGVMLAARRIAPRTELHVSTQAGVMNYQTANALYDLGASRVVLAREMTLAQIHELRAKTPADLQIEAFVHGSMCMAFSGRCMISKYLTGRDPNHGDCAQSCRWKYHVVEEKRPGELFGLEEDSRGTYLFNSQDMNLLEHVDQILDAGVTSLKIEGRAKGAYYAAAMSNAYQYALQAWKRQRTAEASGAAAGLSAGVASGLSAGALAGAAEPAWSAAWSAEASGAVGNTAAMRSVAGETVFLADDTLGEPVPPRVELPEWVRAEPFKVT